MGRSVDSLLLENNDYYKKTDKISFIGTKGKDVYNITAPFVFEGSLYISGRLEPRENTDAESCFFKKIDETTYELCDYLPKYKMEDPFITKIKDEYVLGGVEVSIIDGKKSWKTVFYRGKSIKRLERFAESPNGMKDVRLVDLDDGIGVFTRPQGGIYGGGEVGFILIDDLKELTIEKINNAKIIDLFTELEWGGVNEAKKFSESEILAIGHIAKYSKGKIKHYYAISFIFDYKSNEYSKLKIIAKSDDFDDTEAKREDLRDVVFPGGVSDYFAKKIKLFVGIGDAQAQIIEIDNPFI